MFMEERQKDIIRKINQTGRILVSEIQDCYQVSADCARRDLRVLESRGLLQRTHGGDIKEIQTDYLAVAKKAIEYIQNKEVIYITTSLVGYYMAENLPEDITITVLTNSVTIAEALRKKMNISVILLGGEMSHRGHCHDFYTLQMVKNIRIFY